MAHQCVLHHDSLESKHIQIVADNGLITIENSTIQVRAIPKQKLIMEDSGGRNN